MGRGALVGALLGLAVAAVPATARTPVAQAQVAQARADTGVVNVSNSPGYSEGEEPLSVNPRDPNQLVTVANVYQPFLSAPLSPFLGGGGFQDTRVYSSQDGGRHWYGQKLDQGGLGALPNPLPLPGTAPEFSDALNVINTDADSVWDRHGNAYFESGDIHGLYHGGDEQATVWRSQDGGVGWGPQRGMTAVSSLAEHEELDRPWFAVDNSGGPHDGRLYMTFETSPFLDNPPRVFLKYSDDHGRSWGPTVRVDDGTYQTQFNPRARPSVGADGTVYVVYDRAPITNTILPLPQLGTIALVVARSTDGGQTFARSVAEPDVHRITDPDEAAPYYTEMIAAIAADPAHPGRVAIAWPEALGRNSSRIVLRYATDGGRHWGGRLDVPDDSPALQNQHDHVTLAWLGDGHLFAGWRDRRCCGGGFDANYEQFVRVFSDDGRGGLAPGTTVTYSDGPQLPTGSGRGVLQPDEFQGLVATPLGVGLTWSQLVGQYSDLMFRRVAPSAFGIAGTSAVAGCVDTRRFSYRLHGLPGQRTVRVLVYVGRRRARELRGRSLRRVVLHSLPAGDFTLRIVAYTSRGDRVISARHYSGCAQSPRARASCIIGGTRAAVRAANARGTGAET